MSAGDGPIVCSTVVGASSKSSRRAGNKRPILVVDAPEIESPRIFSFLGNMPVVRWQQDPDQVVSALLLELVRTRYLSLLFGALSKGTSEATAFMLHPPDIMQTSVLSRSPGPIGAPAIQTPRSVVYPDPPLPAEELGPVFS